MSSNLTPFRRRALVTAAAAAAVAAAPLLAAPAWAATGSDGTVTVVHGVPDLPVDVYVNGKATLTDFQPGTVTSPLSLPAGNYEIAVRKAGSAATAAPAISGSAQLPAGANVSLVAHLSADGSPTLTPFVNETEVTDGKARLTVRHTAAAPAVDVRAGGTPVVEGLTNPQSRSLEVDPGTVSADVVLAGQSEPVIGPASLNLADGSNTVVYAIGSAEDDTLRLVTQDVSAAATSAPAGSGGSAYDDGFGSPALLALGLGGAALLAVGGRRLVAARR